MKFANINTGQIVDSLSTILELPGRTITGATIREWQQLGWREIVQVEEPAAGYRAGTYNIVEIDALTCRLTIATSINIADEQAAFAAAALTAAKSSGKDLLDFGTYDLALVLRAFSTLVLQEINTLRTKAGLSTYTQQQFITALKAKIDAL